MLPKCNLREMKNYIARISTAYTGYIRNRAPCLSKRTLWQKRNRFALKRGLNCRQ